MLQRLTEDLEYHELLDRAARCESSLEQLCYVAAFTVSSYSTTVFRTSKPFNPLLGETFELDRLEENGYRSLCEQVQPAPLSPSLSWATGMAGTELSPIPCPGEPPPAGCRPPRRLQAWLDAAPGNQNHQQIPREISLHHASR